MLKKYLPNKYNSKNQERNFSIIRLQNFFEYSDDLSITNHHKINFYVILLITEGSGKHSIEYKDYSYKKGTILTVRKNQTQHFYNTEAEGFVIFFKEDFLNRYLNDLEISKSIQAFNELLTTPKTILDEYELIGVKQLVEHLDREMTEIYDEYSLKIIRSLLHILISLIHRIKSKGYDKVQLTNYLSEFTKFQNLVENNYSKTKKVEDYAKKMGFSTKKLNTIVAYVCNKSVKNFIDDIVIIKAKKNLLHTNMSVKEVSFKLGFNDPTNFYKYFKKHTSLTPETYKKRYKI
jgi:AraC-like DNA-binding protein